MVIEREPRPAFSVSIEQPSTSAWSAALWIPEGSDRSGELAAPPQMAQWMDAENWRLDVPLKRGSVSIERAGAQLVVSDQGSGNTVRAMLAAAPDISAERAALHASYAAAQADSRRRPEVFGYRMRITYLLAAVLVGQELLWFLLRKRLARYRYRVRGALSAA